MTVASPTLAYSIEPIAQAIRQRQLRRRESIRAALKLADQLLNQLELLLLTGRHDVPASLVPSIDGVRRAATWIGVDGVTLETTCGVLRLMDDVYDLEARLLRRLH